MRAIRHLLVLLVLGILIGCVNAEVPVADFSGDPTTGPAPLMVSFTDASGGDPTGWAWFFGDEDYSAPWTQENASAGWEARSHASSVVLPDGSIILMGGTGDGCYTLKNDVWRTSDSGRTWIRMKNSAPWAKRWSHSSVAMPDGSIVLTGGTGGVTFNDTWRSTDNGITWAEMNLTVRWAARYGHSSVVMPDGSIVLMGGRGHNYWNDTWRSTDNGKIWMLMNASGGWPARLGHASVVMPDGSIVLMGGFVRESPHTRNDVWRSTDMGATWVLVNASAAWTARDGFTSIVMPDGSIVLTGGGAKDAMWRSKDNGATWTRLPDPAWLGRIGHTSVVMPDGSIVLTGGNSGGVRNDVWRLTTAGSLEQTPSHTYTRPGTYAVTLQAYNSLGFASTRKAGYITVNLSVKPLPGYPDPPTDPDGDGIYEDLNGNGRLDFADVVLYFNQMTWISENEPIEAFDLNHNNRIDFADIVKLFEEV